jgi:N-acetylglucosamine-6-phosphate deacetylase
MSDGEICGRLYSTSQAVRLRWQSGCVAELAPCSAAEAGDRWLAPPLLDLQINGFAGVDFQQDDLDPRLLSSAVAGLQNAACSQFLLTLMTDRWEPLLLRLRRLHSLRVSSPLLKHAILGWHIEGPFLSAEPGYCGAHDPNLMLDPTRQHLIQLREAAGEDPLLLTLAPERRGALECIPVARNLGITVSLGHTNAAADIVTRAVDAGAVGFTHLANACPQQLDRHDNIVLRVLDDRRLTVSLIPDGLHVSPRFFRLVHRLQDPGKIYYTSDAVAPAGAPSGRYRIGQHTVEVGPDRVVRKPGQSNFAGSALGPIEGIVRAASMLGRPWQNVWDFFSVNPARLMGQERAIRADQPADLCIIESADKIRSVTTVVRGTRVGRFSC